VSTDENGLVSGNGRRESIGGGKKDEIGGGRSI
jgi:hypothetical protein